MLSSNLHPAGFDELMPKTIANTTVDRLLHHAHAVLTVGYSIRLTQATTGKDLTPLTNSAAGTSVGHDRAVLMSATGQNRRLSTAVPGQVARSAARFFGVSAT